MATSGLKIHGSQGKVKMIQASTENLKSYSHSPSTLNLTADSDLKFFPRQETQPDLELMQR